MHLTLLKQPSSDYLARATLKQDIIRKHHGCAPLDCKDGLDVLEEIELLVTGADPEIIAHYNVCLALLSSLLVHVGNAALLAKGRIGEHHFEAFSWITA